MGRGTSGLRKISGVTLSERDKRIAQINAQEYQYHATTGSAIFSIFEQGLKPNRGHAGRGVYFAPDEKGALEWTATSSTGGTKLLRVKTDTLRSKYAWGVLDESESTADKKINSKDIEIKLGNEWMSISDFVKKRRTSYALWKAKH